MCRKIFMKKNNTRHTGRAGQEQTPRLLEFALGRTLLALAMIAAMLATASAIDFRATPESTWEKYISFAHPVPLSDARLRLALEMSVFGGPIPAFPWVTPMGIEQRYWNRVIAQHGLPAVADQYITFLRRLKAELSREQQNQAK